MYQQINMYQPVFRRQRKIFSAATLAMVVGLATALLLGVYGHARWTLHGLQRTSADLTLNYRTLSTRLVALETASPEVAANEEFALQQERIRARYALLEHIDRLDFTTAGDFGDTFEALARQDATRLWLTGVRLEQDGSSEIRGSTLDAALVPRYLKLITRQPRLAVLTNGTVDLMRPEPEDPRVNFILSYKAQETAP